MKRNIYDSEETLKLGLKAEQDTIIEYTKYLNMAKNAGNESEVKLWEHIIADEQEHVKEFENALKGDFNLLDSDPDGDIHIISGKSMAQIRKEQERGELFYDAINDCLVDANIDRNKFSIKIEEYPYAYVDFGDEKEECEKAYEALRDSFFDATLVDDDGFYYITVKRR